MCTLALTPLLVVAVIDIKTLAALGAGLAVQTGQALSDQTRASLEQLADDYSSLIAHQRRTLELQLTLQAREAERLLALPAIPSGPLHWAEEFRAAPARLGLLERRDKYFTQLSATTQAVLPISETSLVMHARAGVERTPLLPQAQRLALLADYFKISNERTVDSVYWRYVALENGLHASYPGHGGYPPEYDPRVRDWYLDQKQRRALTWSPPHTDVTSRLQMMSVTLPILRPNGELLGVTGIDVRLTRLLGAVHLPAYLATDSRVLLTTVSSAVHAPQIQILARQDRIDSGGDWLEKPKLDLFVTDNSVDTALLVTEMLSSHDGFMRTVYHGGDVFCVFRRFDDHATYLVFLVPIAAAARPATEAAAYALTTTRRQGEALVLVALSAAGLVALAAVIASRWITGPIQQLSRTVSAVAAGNFDVTVDIRSGDEFEALGAHFNRMIPQIESHAYMKQALALAREVQQTLLPQRAPTYSGLDIHGSCVYADETGGDYFDYLDLRAHAVPVIGVVIGDVSGHGIASALLMTTARAVLHSTEIRPASLHDTLQNLNDSLFEHAQRGWFMTLLILLFDLEQHSLHWVSAGHEPVQYFAAERREFIELSGDDIPLGIDRTWRYSNNSKRHFAPGDIFVLATDGVFETQSPQGQRFGKERLRAAVETHVGLPAQRLCEELLAALARFRADAPPHDDLTLVVIKITADATPLESAVSPS